MTFTRIDLLSAQLRGSTQRLSFRDGCGNLYGFRDARSLDRDDSRAAALRYFCIAELRHGFRPDVCIYVWRCFVGKQSGRRRRVVFAEPDLQNACYIVVDLIKNTIALLWNNALGIEFQTDRIGQRAVQQPVFPGSQQY